MAGTTGTAKPKMGKGLTLTLQILAGINMAACIGVVSGGLSAGWPAAMVLQKSEVAIITMAWLTVLQIPLRIVAVAMISRWTWRLTLNARNQTRPPVSTLWAWLGWFVPGACFFLPASAVMALNRDSGLAPRRKITILAWWIMRLATCGSGVVLLFVFIVVYQFVAKLPLNSIAGANYLGTTIYVWLGVFGILAHLLEFIVVTLTYRRQPELGAIIAADIF